MAEYAYIIPLGAQARTSLVGVVYGQTDAARAGRFAPDDYRCSECGNPYLFSTRYPSYYCGSCGEGDATIALYHYHEAAKDVDRRKEAYENLRSLPEHLVPESTLFVSEQVVKAGQLHMDAVKMDYEAIVLRAKQMEERQREWEKEVEVDRRTHELVMSIVNKLLDSSRDDVDCTSCDENVSLDNNAADTTLDTNAASDSALDTTDSNDTTLDTSDYTTGLDTTESDLEEDTWFTADADSDCRGL